MPQQQTDKAYGVANPKHKRSRLIRLSSLGRDSFAEIRRNEAAIVDGLFAEISDEALNTTQATLTALLKNIH